jgi:hypothetical protein
MKNIKSILLLGAIIGLSGCASMNQSPSIHYQGLGYINPNITSIQKGSEPNTTIMTPQHHYFSAQGFANSSDIKRAFANYIKTGKMIPILGSGFITLPFDRYTRSLVSCAPSQSAQILLESGEKIEGLHIDNADQWQISNMKAGQSVMVIITPKSLNESTNLTIATDKRIYSIGLVSHKGVFPIVNFWYPDQIKSDYENQIQVAKARRAQLLSNTISTKNEYRELDQINFNYNIKMVGQPIENKPTSVYSDGKQMVFTWDHLNTKDIEAHGFLLGKDRILKTTYQSPYLYISGVYKKLRITFKSLPQSQLIVEGVSHA